MPPIATRIWHQKGRLFAYLLALLFLLILCWPERLQIPVAGAGPRDWNPHSYWAYPWGKSVVHKGIDIFAKRGTPTLAASSGVVLYQGHIEGHTVAGTPLAAALLCPSGQQQGAVGSVGGQGQRDWHCGRQRQRQGQTATPALQHSHATAPSLALG